MSGNPPVRWHWARNGAIVGTLIVLSDLLFEWGGPMFASWSGERITFNTVQILSMIGITTFVGLAAGYFRDNKKLQGGQP